MSEIIESSEILKLLPHRYPFLLVDRVLEYEPFEYLTAIKNVTINEPFFEGHFPRRPTMPGVLMLEALAQACAILSNKSTESTPGMETIYYFAGIDNARFKRIVVPGDQLLMEVSVLGRKKDFWRMSTKASVEGKMVCSADLMSAVKEIPCD